MSCENLLALYDQSNSFERHEGFHYYDWQRSNLESFAEAANVPLRSVIASIAALSPNLDEAGNYRALASCLAIVSGMIHESAPVMGYPLNRLKALTILSGQDPLSVLKGQKVTAFYHNTLNPDDHEGTYTTIDGHMHGAWAGQRMLLRRKAEISPKLYAQIKLDLWTASVLVKIPPVRLQSILWLTWKRLNRIIYSAQLKFESGYSLRQAREMIAHAPASRTSYPKEAGKLTAKVISFGQAAQLDMEFDEANERTVLCTTY